MNSDYDNMTYELETFEKQFKAACQQIVQLNRRLDEMSVRYDRANKAGRRTFRYSLRLKIAVIEGVRNMYYDFASNKADQITDLRAIMTMGDTMGIRPAESTVSLDIDDVLSSSDDSDFEEDSAGDDSEVEMLSDDQQDPLPLDQTAVPGHHLSGHACC